MVFASSVRLFHVVYLSQSTAREEDENDAEGSGICQMPAWLLASTCES